MGCYVLQRSVFITLNNKPVGRILWTVDYGMRNFRANCLFGFLGLQIKGVRSSCTFVSVTGRLPCLVFQHIQRASLNNLHNLLLQALQIRSLNVLAFSSYNFHLLWSWMQLVQSFIFSFFMSFLMSSSHLFFGLPGGRVNIGFHLYTFFYRSLFRHSM